MQTDESYKELLSERESMRGSLDVKIRSVGTHWPKPYRVIYYTGDFTPEGNHVRVVGWGNTIEDATQRVCVDPRTAQFDDLRGYILRSLGAIPAEFKTEVGAKQNALLGMIPDLHNLYAVIACTQRGSTVKFRAEAMAPEPEFVARYENDLAMYYGTNIARITMPLKPPLRLIEFSVPATLVSSEARFFYRSPDELKFFRENNPRTTFADVDATVPIEGITFLL